MKRFLLFFVAVAAVVFTGCSKDDESGAQKSLEIEVKTGDTYAFDNPIDEVITAPNEFYAETTQNGIKGIHEGVTTAKVKSGGIIYDCKIVVSAKNTLYLDMMYLLGAEKDSIIKIYGEPIKQEGDVYLFGPMMGFGAEKGNLFSFKNGKVEMSAIVFSSLYATEIGAHLADRYVLALSDDSSLLFVNGLTYEDWTVGALVSIDSSTIYVYYASKEYLEALTSEKMAKMPFKDVIN